MTPAADELAGEAAAEYRAWALSERAQTDAVLYEYLVSRITTSEKRAKALAIMEAYPYPALPAEQA